MRIVNASRGGIIDEDALAEAVRTGHVAGAALDVFAAEPTTESPLFELDGVVVTPHLAASTPEAQDKAGVVIAQLCQALGVNRKVGPVGPSRSADVSPSPPAVPPTITPV